MTTCAATPRKPRARLAEAAARSTAETRAAAAEARVAELEAALRERASGQESAQ